MNSNPLPAWVPVGLSFLILSSLLVVYGGGCSGSEADESEAGAAKRGDATQRVVDELFGEAAPEPEPTEEFPELGFLRQSDGLPKGGTWREYPLLHDFTGDGRADLVAANREEDGLNAWRSPAEGAGTWQLSIEGLPRDLMYGGSGGADLDGDGDQDLVFVAHKTGLRVFMNDGGMRWTPGAEVPNPFLILDVALGDLNGDEKVDAVGIGHFNGGIGVYMGDGEGGFERLDASKDIIPAGRFGTEIQLADLDGDGLDDLVACTDKGAVAFYTRKSEDSDALNWQEGSTGLPAPEIGNALRGLVPADFTADGHLELAFCALADPGVPEDERDNAGVLQRSEDGSWRRIDRGLPTGRAFHDIAAGDLDQDGHADLVLLASRVGAMVYRGDGEGGFTLSGRLPDSARASWLALGDADGDGRLDIALQSADNKRDPTGGGLVVFLNRVEAWGNK